LAEVVAAPLVEFHPNAADSYRKKVQDLRAALAAADDENRLEAYRGIRDLVEKIVIKPTGPYKPIDLEIHGRLATLLRASTEGTIEKPKSMGALVAGIGFEPMTFRL
jgi:site-specific DNA recombinase